MNFAYFTSKISQLKEKDKKNKEEDEPKEMF